MKFRHWWQELVLAGLAALSLLLSGLLILSSLRLHLDEMKWQLQKSEFLEGNSTKMFLVAHFVDQYQFYQEKLSRSEVDEREFRMNALYPIRNSVAWKHFGAQGQIDWISRHIINALRSSTGKQPLTDQTEVQTFEDLDRALQLERARAYKSSIDIFKGILTRTSNPRMQGIVELHIGFCHAVQGNDTQAVARYESVIQSHPHDDLGITAALLLQHLKQLMQERIVIAKASLGELERARKLTSLLQCEEVLGSFDPERITNPRNKAEVYLLRARCAEEVGKRDLAIQSYTETIRISGKSDLARDANRRLYMMGSLAPSGKHLQDIARDLNKTLGDQGLDRMESLNKSMEDQGESLGALFANVDSSLQAIQDQSMLTLQETANQLGKSNEEPRTPPVSSSFHPKGNQEIPVAPKLSLPEIGTKVRIALINGKTFVGRMNSGAGEPGIRLQTMIGEIQIDPEQVESIIPQ